MSWTRWEIYVSTQSLCAEKLSNFCIEHFISRHVAIANYSEDRVISRSSQEKIFKPIARHQVVQTTWYNTIVYINFTVPVWAMWDWNFTTKDAIHVGQKVFVVAM